MIICPNFSNPDVAREFNELKEATTEKAAYAIWSRNNGNAIDKAPNGAQSKLFQNLLNYFKGDRNAAIKSKAKIYSNEFIKWFGNWTGQEGLFPEYEEKEVENVSKAVDENGEPLMLWHGTDYVFDEFKYDENNERGSHKVHDVHSFFFTDSQEKAFKYRYNITMPVFLNMKNPGESSVKDGKYRTLNEYTNRENELIRDNRYDSVLIERYDKEGDHHGMVPTKQWVVKNPNQIKSILNDGTYTSGNNIYHNLSGEKLETISDLKRVLSKILTRQIGFRLSRTSDQISYSRTSITKEQAQKKLIATLSLFGIPENAAYLSDNGWVQWRNNVLQDYLQESQNAIDHSTNTSLLEKQALASFLIDKFKHIKGVKFKSLKGENGRFEDGWVILNKNASLDIAAEECLHPFVAALKSENQELFNELLKEASKDFKQLKLEIEERYGNKKGQDVDMELVTQALARHFTSLWESPINEETEEKQKSIWRRALEYILDLLRLDFTKLDRGITLQELAENIYRANDITIPEVYFENKTYFNLSQQAQDALDNSITRQIYDLGIQIDTERQQYIASVLNQYKINNPNATSNDLSRVMNNARKQFNIDKSNDLMRQKQIALAQVFGLNMNADGFYESQETTQKKLMLEYFINSLQKSTFDAYNLENINRTKYQQVGSVQNATSIGNVIYTALWDSDLATLDKELARDYVRMFWGSDLIQSALDALKTQNQTPQELEDALVDRMTTEPVSSRDTSIIDWFRNIWNQLQQLVKTVFGSHTFTDQQKNDILKAVDAAYMISEDLGYTNVNNVIYDRADGNYNSSIMLSEKDKEVLSNIKAGIKTRLKSQLARNTKNQKLIADLRTALEVIDSKNEDSIDDVFNIIQEFLINANREIGVTRYYIDNTLLLKNSMDDWDPQQINFIQQDLIGYYKNLLSTVANLFSDRKSSINKFNTHRVQSDPNAIDLKNVSKQLVNDIDGLQNDYNHRVVKPYVRKILIDYVNQEDAISDKGLFIYNMEKWLEQDQSYGDLAAGEVIIGMASRSKSPIVRIVEKMMSEAEYTTSRQVLKKGHDLIKLYNKVRPTGSQISPYNWQKRFMEFDDTNTSTGYFVREINYGQFYKDKDAKENELRLKYGLFVDENGDTIFPDEDSTKDDSVYNKYYDELDEWLDKHCERRYKLEYYKAKRRRLSPATIKAQNQLQRQIDLLLDKCRMTNGFVDLSKLSVNERRQLEVLRKQKRDLGSHYIFTEENGILKVEPKTGESLKMADEITAWNDYLKNKVNYKPDWTSFNQAKQQLINNGATQQEIQNFERNNTTIRLTSEFYDILQSVSKHSFVSKELNDLKHRHREIINALKVRPGAGSHNLNKLGTGLNTDQSGWAELQRIEQRMAEVKRKLLQSQGGVANQSSLKFEDVAKMMYVTVDDTSNQSYIDYLINQWRNASYTNTSLVNVFNQLFTYIDEKGKRRYLNAFKYLSPINWTIDVNGKVIKCIDTVPGSEYSELDESSLLVNENFVKDGKSMQPKAFDSNGKRLYKNESYEKLTSDEKTFLQALLDTMDEANSMIPNKALYRDELLPQISGRTMSVLSNTLRNMEWQTALKYSVRKFGVKYAETTEDVSTNVDLARRPDGTVVNNIPIRFVNKLDNPAVQTTDVLGSVIMFYDMACNYKNKSQNLPVLELIKYSISPDSRTQNRMPEQYAKVENLLDQRYYGKETSFGFNTNEKITDAKQRVIQGTKTIRNFASVAMLGVNFTTIEVGYIDAMCSMLADAIGGKYLTTQNMRRAFIHCIKHTPNMLKGLGKQVVNDKLVAAMQYNQLSRSNSEIFSATDKFKLDRFVHDHLLMGGYTLTDYMVNSMMVYATYDHYRLILDPKTNKNKFYSKTDAINEFTKLGYTESEAVDLWENAKTTLWEAYDCINGDFVLKDAYKDIVTKKLEDRITGRLRDRTAMYNGVIPMTEKAKIQQNVFGSFITLMRNFYINTYWDRFKTGGDYVTEDGNHNIAWYSEYKRDDLGMVNLETGEFEGAVFKDFIRGMYKLTANTKHVLKHEDLNKLTREQKYAVRRSTTELILIGTMLFAMLWSVAFARKNDYDDDKDPAWTLNLTGDNVGLHVNTKNMDDKFYDWFRWKMALLATRGFTERLTSWWMPTAIEPLTSPTVATSYLDDIGTMWHLADDLFSQRADEEIKSGGYKHMTRGTRDILKIMSPLGIDNLVRQWHTEGIKSTFRYYRSMAPTSAIVPTQEEYNIAHGKGKNGGNKNSKNKKNKNQIRME